jgi:hypothetical protein
MSRKFSTVMAYNLVHARQTSKAGDNECSCLGFT